MKPVAIVTEDGSGALIVHDRYEDARSAEKALRDLEPGTYHIVRFIQHGVEVAAPEPQPNVVKPGTRFVTRERAK